MKTTGPTSWVGAKTQITEFNEFGCAKPTSPTVLDDEQEHNEFNESDQLLKPRCRSSVCSIAFSLTRQNQNSPPF